MGEALFRSTRSRQSVPDFVSWLKYTASCPCNVADGIPRPDITESGSHYDLALWFREAMYAQLFHPSRVVDSVPQKRQKVNPSIYEDESEITSRISRTLRSSDRILSLRNKPPLSSCSAGSMDPDKESDEGFLESEANGFYHISRNYSSRSRKNIRVGPQHQTKCPEWRSRDSNLEKDPNLEKFLGQRIWPPVKSERRSTLRQVPVKCICLHPDSMECAQLHIRERRLNMKRELGSVFSLLGFDQMGEEVSLSWSKAEEDKFMEMARTSESTLKMSLRDQVFLSFPWKSKREVVSYYFNVFILRRRGYQNRVTMDDATSDDEDEDSLSMGCVENTQCVDVDESDGG